MQQPSSALLLALNIPFCPRRCAYCTRPIQPLHTLDALPGYIAALRREVQAAAPDLEDHMVCAVWIGGGIAGHLFDEALGDLLQDMHRWYRFAPGAEITLKVHPGMFSAETLHTCRRGQITRLSLEYVTADPFESEALGRFLPPSVMDTTQLVLGAALSLRRSFDLLTGTPGQTPATLRRTLETVLRYGAGHVSLYPFRLEAGSAYAAQHCQNEQADQNSLRRHLPTGPEADGLREAAAVWLREQGFVEYLPGRFALPGQESVFLQQEAAGCEQVGFGTGAKTLLDGSFSRNTFDIRRYTQYSPDPAKLTELVRPLRPADFMQ